MRAEHSVLLPTVSGDAVKCTIKRPTIALQRTLGKAGNRLTFVNKSRAALASASTDIVARLAIAEVALEHAPADKAEAMSKEVADLQAANDAIQAKIDAKDDEQGNLMVEQLRMLVNVPKGDSDAAPEIDWESVEIDTIKEATSFFMTGSAPSSPTPSA